MAIRDNSYEEQEVSFEMATLQQTPASNTQPPLLLLSRTASLIDIIKRAAPNGSRVIVASTLDNIADQLPKLAPGILVIDTACIEDIAATAAQLTQHLPELVIVVVGQSEDSGALMRLAATGHIYRFLLSPLSHGQTKLTLESAMTHHVQLGAAANRRTTVAQGGTRTHKNHLLPIVVLGIVLVLAVTGIWWFMGHTQPKDVHTNAAVPTHEPVNRVQTSPADEELVLADTAFAAGNYLEPAGESALDLYRSALDLDQNNLRAKAGIQQVIDKILERAETALTAEKLEDAVTALEQVREIDPTNSHLKFLDGQIERERMRLKLTQSHEANQNARALVTTALQHIDAGRLINPPGKNALSTILAARRIDPTEPSIAQTLRSLSAHLIEAARQEVDNGNVERAQEYLRAARQTGSVGNELNAIERRVNELRSANAKRRVYINAQIDTVRKLIASGNLISPNNNNARDLIANIRATDPERVELKDLTRSLSEHLVSAAQTALSAKQTEQAEQLITATKQLGAQYYQANTLTQLEREVAQLKNTVSVNSQATTELPPVPLKRIKTVLPIYPADAKRRGISGWVEVTFLVTQKGTVEDPSVVDAEPKGIFERAALDAVRRWRYEVPMRNGVPTSQRYTMRLRFDNSQ